jgi:PelA/Pel-15E family pectate lyase
VISRNPVRIGTAGLLAAVLLGGFLRAESVELTGDWWSAPAAPNRHTTLVCSFDSDELRNADYARDFGGAGGWGTASDSQGAHGLALAIAEPGGHLNFRGGSNVQPHHGTARFAVKGNVWELNSPHWLFDIRGADRIGIVAESGKLSLVICPGTRTDQFISRLDLPVGTVSADDWHWVVASWDRAAGKGWISLDGDGVSGDLTFSQDFRPPFALFLGGAGCSRPGGLNAPPLAFDDLVLYDLPLPLLQAQPAHLPPADAEYLPTVEQGLRQTLGMMADLQRWGGWQTLYTWPTLLGSAAQGRDYIDFDDYIDNDKGNGSCPLAATFLWAYQTMGDTRFLDVALRTGEFILAAQAPEGYWLHGYRMTVHGVKPVTSPRNIKLQDQVQAHPMLLLTYLHRTTGEQRYLDAVLKAGEFYLQAQNPNGSWPHHYDLTEKTGKTARGIPGGGELNDRAANDAADMMVLMYHLTDDSRYLQALKRLGDWLVEAQGRTVPLWSDQYDAENNPVWARHFEPPAYGTTATVLACQALRELYRYSADSRYLDAIQRAAEWAEENLPDGRMSTFVDPESGRPIAAWDRTVYFLDEPEALEFLKTVPVGSGYLKTRDLTRTLGSFLRGAQALPPSRQVLTDEGARQALESKRSSAARAMDTRNEAGVWTVPVVADYMGSIGEGFGATIPRASLMLAYVEAARIAMGELTERVPGSHNMLVLAYPDNDWYNVPWPEADQQ